MIKLFLILLLVCAVGAAIGIPLRRRYLAARRQRHRAKEQAYVETLRAKWDQKHSEPAETFVERRRPWDGVERRRPKPPQDR